MFSTGLKITASAGDTNLSTRLRRVLVFRSSAVSSKRSTRTAAISCPARDLDRVARIGRLEVGLVLAVGIGQGDAGGKKSAEIRRRKRIVRLRVGSIGKYPGVAHVDAGLPAELRSEADRVEHRPGEAFVDEVGIVERVLAIGHVIVGGAIEQGIG